MPNRARLIYRCLKLVIFIAVWIAVAVVCLAIAVTEGPPGTKRRLAVLTGGGAICALFILRDPRRRFH